MAPPRSPRSRGKRWTGSAARDLAEGRFVEAVDAFDKAGAITWTAIQEEACKALVAAWTRDADAHPGASRFVFAYTNRDVDALNAKLRHVRRERGELAGADVRFETKHGPADFAVGDRVQFTDTDRKLRIYNGNTGTITAIDERTGQITARRPKPGSMRRIASLRRVGTLSGTRSVRRRPRTEQRASGASSTVEYGSRSRIR
jgi:ATP-dependent exoDNAse (exonuclease V) alpha subunit